jgi:hypothetical protein
MPDTTTKLLLPYILAAQAQKHVTHNEALRLLDGLVQMSVSDRDLTAPPSSPVEGDRYIVAIGATGATGDWSGWDDDIALFGDGIWFRLPKQVGWRAWVQDEGTLVVWDGTQWFDLSSVVGSDGANAYDVWLAEGNTGTEADFLASLIGLDGADGPVGSQGPAGADGAQGSVGPVGPAGADGADGTSVTILGSLASTGDLPGSGNTPGDGYVISGDLHVWDGAVWNNAGPIQGPAGPAGITWQGAWVSATDYIISDAVEHLGASYLCIADHTAGAASEPGVGGTWTSSWDLLAAKGDSGTDGADGAAGATGPQGLDGAAGADGLDGASGAAGADGDSFVWQSDWATATGYILNDLVAHQGSSYIAIAVHTSGAASEPGIGGNWASSWDLLAEKADLSSQSTLGSGPVVLARRTVNAQAGSYTLVIGDEGAAIHMTSASAVTLTVPLSSAVAFPSGSEIEVVALGAGVVSIAGDTGVLINGVSAGSADIAAQWQGVVLRKYATDSWLLIGSIGDLT